MGAESVLWKWLRRQHSGTARDCPPCPYAGYWCEILKESSLPKPCCAPTLAPGPSRSWDGLSCVGRWRRPSRKYVGTWAWKRKGSVGASNPENHSGAVGVVLDRYPVGPPANDAKHAGSPAGSVVSQRPPDLL